MRSRALVFLLLAAPAPTQESTLVADIGLQPGEQKGSWPRDFVVVGGTAFFSATDPGAGRELWRSSPTGPPARVADLNPFGPSDPADLVAFGGKLYFVATEPVGGRELWCTDGTRAGTQRVVDLSSGASSSDPADLVELGGQLFFSARAGGAGRELWRSDGTAAGTELVVDIFPGPGWSTPAELTVHGGFLYFAANDGIHGNELWRSDGTEPGTVLWTDYAAGSPSGAPHTLTSTSAGLYLSAVGAVGREPARVDESTGAVDFVADIAPGIADSDPGNFAAADGLVLFSADGGTAVGREMWSTAGAGATLIELYPGAHSSLPHHAVTLGDQVVFSAFMAGGSLRAWISDGTLAGTTILADVSSGFSGGFGFTVHGDHVYFGSGDDLVRSDGTPFQEELVLAGDPFGVWSSGGHLWIAGRDPELDVEPHSSDGTFAGTVLLGDLHPGTVSDHSFPGDFHAVADRLVFTAIPDISAEDLWASDGTGVERLYDASSSAYIPEIHGTGSWVFFEVAVSGPDEAWITDGTAAGTRIVDAALEEYGGEFAGLGGTVYFDALRTGGGWELWRTDGTPPGTEVVVATGPTRDLVAFDGELFFVDQTTDAIWRSDGTTAGSGEVFAGASLGLTSLRHLTPVGATLVFVGDEAGGSPGFYALDGPSGVVTQLVSGAALGLPVVDLLTPVGGRVLFVDGFTVADELYGLDVATGVVEGLSTSPARRVRLFGAGSGAFLFGLERLTSPKGATLWGTDGTAAGTHLLLEPSAEGPGVRQVKPAIGGGDAFFAFDDDGAGAVLGRSDGTLAGTALFDLDLGANTNWAFAAPGSDSRVVLAHLDPITGRAVYTSTGDSTELVADVSQDDLGALADDFVRAGGWLFFSGSDGFHGIELHAVPFVETGGWVAESFGGGCAGSAGVVPRISSSTPATLGTAFSVELTDARPLSAAVLLHSLDQAPLPLGGCTLYLGVPFQVTAAVSIDGAGEGAFSFDLPAAWGLVGTPLHLQYVVADPGGAFEGVAAFTGGLEVVAGP